MSAALRRGAEVKRDHLLARMQVVEEGPKLTRTVRSCVALNLHHARAGKRQQVRTKGTGPQGTEIDNERVRVARPRSADLHLDRGVFTLYIPADVRSKGLVRSRQISPGLPAALVLAGAALAVLAFGGRPQ